MVSPACYDAFCLSAFPIAASESLVDARIDYVFILALDKASCVTAQVISEQFLSLGG